MTIRKAVTGRGRMRQHKPDAKRQTRLTAFFEIVSSTSYHDAERTVLLRFVGLDSEVELELPGETANQLAEVLR
jgi:hypothetical protein